MSPLDGVVLIPEMKLWNTVDTLLSSQVGAGDSPQTGFSTLGGAPWEWYLQFCTQGERQLVIKTLAGPGHALTSQLTQSQGVRLRRGVT